MGGVVGLGSALVIKWVIFDFLLKLGVPLFQGRALLLVGSPITTCTNPPNEATTEAWFLRCRVDE